MRQKAMLCLRFLVESVAFETSLGPAKRSLKAISHCNEQGWWHIIDGSGAFKMPGARCEGRDVGKLAAFASRLLQGKHRGCLK